MPKCSTFSVGVLLTDCSFDYCKRQVEWIHEDGRGKWRDYVRKGKVTSSLRGEQFLIIRKYKLWLKCDRVENESCWETFWPSSWMILLLRMMAEYWRERATVTQMLRYLSRVFGGNIDVKQRQKKGCRNHGSALWGSLGKSHIHSGPLYSFELVTWDTIIKYVKATLKR